MKKQTEKTFPGFCRNRDKKWQFVKTRKAMGTITAGGGGLFSQLSRVQNALPNFYKYFYNSRETRGRFVLFLLENTFIMPTVSSVFFNYVMEGRLLAYVSN